MNLKIVTPKKLVLETKCLHITIPSEIGEIQIHKGHTPLLAKLTYGILTFESKKNYTKKIAIEEGFVSIDEKNIIILTENATTQNEVNIQKEKKIIQQLKIQLINIKSEKESEKIQLKINISAIKCQLAK